MNKFSFLFFVFFCGCQVHEIKVPLDKEVEKKVISVLEKYSIEKQLIDNEHVVYVLKFISIPNNKDTALAFCLKHSYSKMELEALLPYSYFFRHGNKKVIIIGKRIPRQFKVNSLKDISSEEKLCKLIGIESYCDWLGVINHDNIQFWIYDEKSEQLISKYVKQGYRQYDRNVIRTNMILIDSLQQIPKSYSPFKEWHE